MGSTTPAGILNSVCGRYVSVQADEDLTAEFDADDETGGFDPLANNGYNIAPTVSVRAVVNRSRRDADGKPAGYRCASCG